METGTYFLASSQPVPSQFPRSKRRVGRRALFPAVGLVLADGLRHSVNR